LRGREFFVNSDRSKGRAGGICSFAEVDPRFEATEAAGDKHGEVTENTRKKRKKKKKKMIPQAAAGM